MAKSPFLEATDRWITENDLAFVINQHGYAVSPGHCLICPKRLVPTVFDMTPEEWDAVRKLLEGMKARNDAAFFPGPDGYNIGANCGAAAGQTVMHAHVHLIPRFKGDHPNPRGGVRAVIPGKADY